MLEVLCGNRSVERVLLFLFVNGKGYGSQLQRAFKTPLTPIQKALTRLEQGGLITSHYEGKTRVYQFNPTYPLLEELELLLKKAYTLLPTTERKVYYAVKEGMGATSEQLNNVQLLLAFWEKLRSITGLTFNATTRSKDRQGWNGKGRGEVTVSQQKSHELIFNEKGHWQDKQGEKVSFSNVFRWTLDRQSWVISLEHLRHGPDNPVFLFHLASAGKHSLASVDSHLCGGDAYFGQIQMDPYGLHFNWRVIGPKKNEEIVYYYT